MLSTILRIEAEPVNKDLMQYSPKVLACDSASTEVVGAHLAKLLCELSLPVQLPHLSEASLKPCQGFLIIS